MDNQKIINWLLEGDPSIQFQVWRDLLGVEKRELQDRIEKEGWGYQFLSKRHSEGHWGDRFYQPKWISSHYTLLHLRNLNLSPGNKLVKDTIDDVLKHNIAMDGGIQLGPSTAQASDICVNGMFLNYASYFTTSESKLISVIDCILKEIMPDGGFNCRTTRSGAKHSSLHTTISVLEGLTEFRKAGNTYRNSEIETVKKSAIEFILQHHLFLSDHTGQIISQDFLKLRYPCRWKYDILRALDYFQYEGMTLDQRMKAALAILKSKRNLDGSWNVPAAHPGQVHFSMEKAGKPSRWNTLRVLRVLKCFEEEFQ